MEFPLPAPAPICSSRKPVSNRRLKIVSGKFSSPATREIFLMTSPQLFIFSILFLLLVLFIWGRWRYDIIALAALLVATVTGLVPEGQAFSGFGHPAVITVAAVLVVSRGLMNSGMVDFIARLMARVGENASVQLSALVVAVTVCSGFMNNIGALAFFMPVAIRLARKNQRSPSLFLMPLAFGSLLGGLITLVGTPPNIIISSFREQATGIEPFRMFDFAPVGAGVALAGMLFIILAGWRFIPRRKGQLSREDLFEIEDYITEIRVPDESKFAGKRLRELEKAIEGDVIVVGHVRDDLKLPAPSPYRVLKAGDSVIVKASADELQELLDASGLELAASEKVSEEDLRSEEINIVEATVTTNSGLEGRTARSLNLRSGYGINLLGVAREGGRLRSRPDSIRLRAGDVLLLQGGTETLQEVLPTLGCLPLAERGLRLGQPRRVFLGLGIFSFALTAAALGLLPVQIAFSGAAVVLVLAGFLSLREIYESIDWPVIILLGAMIPVSQALETTGGAQMIADSILFLSGTLAPWITLTLVLVVSMLLSNVVNNAAAAVLMAPIAISIGSGMGASLEPFLMSVAVGASCAFLTPIGHQSNTLVMGPGGYHFGDYWRLGLPLSIIVAVSAVPLIMRVWPLGL